MTASSPTRAMPIRSDLPRLQGRAILRAASPAPGDGAREALRGRAGLARTRRSSRASCRGRRRETEAGAPGSRARRRARSLLFGFGNGFFANMVYEKADWDYKTASLEAAARAGRREDRRRARRRRPGPEPVRGSRRQADPVPRLERSRDLGPQQRRLLRERRAPDGRGPTPLRSCASTWLRACSTAATVPGPAPSADRIAGLGSPPQPRSSRCRAGRREAPRPRRGRHTVRGQLEPPSGSKSHDEAAALPLSPAGGVPGHGRHQRRLELQLRRELRPGIRTVTVTARGAGLGGRCGGVRRAGAGRVSGLGPSDREHALHAAHEERLPSEMAGVAISTSPIGFVASSSNLLPGPDDVHVAVLARPGRSCRRRRPARR